MTSQPVWNKKPQTIGLFEKMKHWCRNCNLLRLVLLPSEPEGKKQTTGPGEGRSSAPNESTNREMGRRKGK